MTTFTERNDLEGTLQVDVEGDATTLFVEDRNDSASFYADNFDLPLIALAIIGEDQVTDGEQMTVSMLPDTSDEVLVDLARAALRTLKDRREAAAAEERARKIAILDLEATLGGPESPNLTLTKPIAEQLYNLGLRAKNEVTA
ncbi:hypothetical protein [Arthrobacter sp. 18067]|uniref:hypothetical protein n=1 Tax=Arthrobacter sp. 18067 TaxID=2681413 RepID=UPI00135B02A6|nr:hypothetical protein [Arthrobacter sp. 18067]